MYLKILRIQDPPERIARGAAIGVLMGVLPTFGAGAFLSLAFAFVLKANKAAAVLGSFVMNPLTSTFFWTLSIVIGSVILGEDYSTMLAKIKGDNMINGIGGAYLVFLAGNVVISSTFAVASYFIIKNAVIKRRALKEEKRLKKAGEGHAGM